MTVELLTDNNIERHFCPNLINISNAGHRKRTGKNLDNFRPLSFEDELNI